MNTGREHSNWKTIGGIYGLRLRIISVGKVREPFYADGVKEYLKRLGNYTAAELVSGLEEKVKPRGNPQDILQALDKEGQRILGLLAPDDFLVVCDVAGQEMDSQKLADMLEDWIHSSTPRVNIVIGSAYGLAEDVKKRAQMRLSLSQLTFPHQMTVLIVAEQLYRAFKILRREPYHH